jgi:PRC-barrel domain
MSKSVFTALLFALSTSMASAQTPLGWLQSALDENGQLLMVHHEGDDGSPAQLLTSLPKDVWTVTEWYKQPVYDPGNNKIGEIMDVLVDHEGKNVAAIIGVGGFLGVGEKDVAVPFNAVHFKRNNANSNDWFAVINATRDTLRNAPAYKYDRNAKVWMPDMPSTVGSGGGIPHR